VRRWPKPGSATRSSNAHARERTHEKQNDARSHEGGRKEQTDSNGDPQRHCTDNDWAADRVVVWAEFRCMRAVLARRWQGDPETLLANRMANFPIDFAIRLANWLALLACALRGFRRNGWRLQFH
jgi:hypothetical protein